MNELVLIISAYGRGHSLAVSLQRAGIPVKVMEVSDSLGVWIPEEIEGPFGFFQNEQIDELHKERLIEDDPLLPVPEGFCIWLKDGPLELHGPNISHRMQKMSLNFDLNKPSFLSEISRYYATHILCYQKQVYNLPSQLPIFSNFFIRMPTRQGFNKSLEWCRRNNVDIIEKVQMMDLLSEGRKNLKALEYRIDKSLKSELIEFSNIVWCLSSEETLLINEKIRKVLYPKGIIEPEWIWSRYRVKLSEGAVRDQIPLHSLLIHDLDQPWTHENFCILIRTASDEQFDIWMRMPAHQRFNKTYLEERGGFLADVLSKKLINLSIEIIQHPIGYDKTFEEVGPSRQPIFSLAQLQKKAKSDFENIIYNSFEQSRGLGWNYYFDYQKEVFKGIESWWTKLQIKKQKKDKRNIS